jgi:CRP/FNR family transcriptional regulator, cyclic AMP receptor protein
MHPVTAGALSRDKTPASGLKDLVGPLANTRLFSLCSTRELRKVAKVSKIRRVSKGTRLMAEGEEGSSMFVLITGIARVTRGGRKVAELSAGDAVGELALLSHSPRNATVDADTDLEVAELSSRSLKRLINDVPSFSIKLLEAMAVRVRELDSRLYP